MKIAYFSPLNPLKSGISDYSEYLVFALADRAIVDLWVSGFTPTNLEGKFKVFDYIQNPLLLEKIPDYDAVIYNIGNNPYFHSHIYDVFLKYNGYVILHDLVLYYLITGYYSDLLNNSKKLIEEAFLNGGKEQQEYMETILSGEAPALQHKNPDKLPLNKRLIQHAKGIMVHSEYAKNKILEINNNANCWVIPQIGPDDNNDLAINESINLKQKYGIEKNDLVIASFGFIAESKRIHKVLEALSKINTKGIKYLLVGEGDYVDTLVKKYRLESIVIKTGFTTIEEFDKLMKLADIVVNLRYPYMGETSASLIRALLFGKPSIVTNIGWFSELPDEVIVKIECDENEVLKLRKHLEELIVDKKMRERYSKYASEYALNYLNNSRVVDSLFNGITKTETNVSEREYKLKYCDKVSNQLLAIGMNSKDQSYINHISRQLSKLL